MAAGLSDDQQDWVSASRELGQSIRIARRAKGMSQCELARLVHRTQAAISQLEHGHWKRVPQALLDAIADALGIDAATLHDQGRDPQRERLAAVLRDALAPMAGRPDAEQAELSAVIRSLIVWRYGADAHHPGQQDPGAGQQ